MLCGSTAAKFRKRFIKYSTVICEGFSFLVRAILQGVKNRFDVLVNVCVKFFACA